MEISAVSGDASTLSQSLLSSLSSPSSTKTSSTDSGSTTELELQQIINKVKQSNNNYTTEQLMSKYNLSRTDAQKVLDKISKGNEGSESSSKTTSSHIPDSSTVQFDV